MDDAIPNKNINYRNCKSSCLYEKILQVACLVAYNGAATFSFVKEKRNAIL